MIISLEPLTIAEVHEHLKDLEGEEKKEMHDFLKKFAKLSKKEADEVKEALLALKNPKIKEEYIVKTIDFLPQDIEEVHKIFNDVSLDEKEASDILAAVKRN